MSFYSSMGPEGLPVTGGAPLVRRRAGGLLPDMAPAKMHAAAVREKSEAEGIPRQAPERCWISTRYT